jgi:hypothetical protein
MWCIQHQHTNFNDYVFADETTIRVLEVPLYHSRRKNERPHAISSNSKIRLKVNIWGAISYKGPSPFLVSFFT